MGVGSLACTSTDMEAWQGWRMTVISNKRQTPYTTYRLQKLVHHARALPTSESADS